MKSKFFNAMLIIALLCTGGYATAQDKAKSNSKHTVKAQSADLATKLNLSESQNTSYQKIMTEHNSKLTTAKQKYGESSTKGQQKIADLETKKEAKLKKLLGSEKYATYLQLNAQNTENTSTTRRIADKSSH